MRREEVLTALSQHRPRLAELGVKSLRLFGSVARDEASAVSDVDLLVAFDHTPSYSEFMRLKIRLEDLLGTRVDLVTERGLRARVRPSVERDAILSREPALFLETSRAPAGDHRLAQRYPPGYWKTELSIAAPNSAAEPLRARGCTPLGNSLS